MREIPSSLEGHQPLRNDGIIKSCQEAYMRIAVFGAGGVGGYFGGRLAQAGEELVFIAAASTCASCNPKGCEWIRSKGISW